MGKIVSLGEEEFIIGGHNLKKINIYYIYLLLLSMLFLVCTHSHKNNIE